MVPTRDWRWQWAAVVLLGLGIVTVVVFEVPLLRALGSGPQGRASQAMAVVLLVADLVWMGALLALGRR